MPPKESGNKGLLQITSQLTKWGPKKLSLAGRAFVINQVILCIYVVSTLLTSLTGSIFARVKALVRNFLWTGVTMGHAKAKVTWEIVMQPLTHRGLKIFDPSMQARALMGKLIA
jgi:hypothetical protein